MTYRIYRLPDHRSDCLGTTFACFPWVASDLAGDWERFGTEEEARQYVQQKEEK